MKTTKKIIALLLSILMLLSVAPMAFAVDEVTEEGTEQVVCDHANKYKIEYLENGSADKYFLKREIPEEADMELYFCNDCNCISVYDSWISIDDEILTALSLMVGLCAPGTCLHRHLTVLPIVPTCKSKYLDFKTLYKLFNGSEEEITDEELQEAIENYGQPQANGEDDSTALMQFCYCEDCKGLIMRETEFNAKGEVTMSVEMNAIDEFKMMPAEEREEALAVYGVKTVEELEALINSTVKDAEPHKYENGKCVYCGQEEPKPEEPKPVKKNFLDKVVDFLKKVGDFLKDVFTFKHIRDLIKK